MEDFLNKELELLKQEHKVLDEQMDKLDAQAQFEKQRLKKRKLWIKDRISYIESIIHPDIIA